MPGNRLLLIDSDVFILLAGTDVLEGAVGALGFALRDCRRLGSLPYQLRKNKRLIERHPPASIYLARQWCRRVSALTERPADDAVFQRLVNVPNIDDGEALMFAWMVERPLWHLASGDKRALFALTTTPSLKDVRTAVSGRIICLETILRELCLRDGVGRTTRAFAALADSYDLLREVFRGSVGAPQPKPLAVLEAALDRLSAGLGEGFLFEP